MKIIGAGKYRCSLCGVVIEVDSTEPPVVSFVAHSGTPTERVVTISTVEIHRCEIRRQAPRILAGANEDAESSGSDDLDLIDLEGQQSPRGHRPSLRRGIVMSSVAVTAIAAVLVFVVFRHDHHGQAIATRPTSATALTSTTASAPAATAKPVTPAQPRLSAPDLAKIPTLGLCPSDTGPIATVELNDADRLPSPRCLIIFPNQRLHVVNGTGTIIHMTLGYHPTYTATIAPHHSWTAPNPTGTRLIAGVYELNLAPFAQSDVWAVPTCMTQTINHCKTTVRTGPPYGIFTCPTQTPTATSANQRGSAISAALAYERFTSHVQDWTIGNVYRVGETDGFYSQIFNLQAPYCGEAVAEASWVVELSALYQGIIPKDKVLVAHFPNGWYVWSSYP